MSGTTTCPACRETVAFDEVTRVAACPACETPLAELFVIARDDYGGRIGR